MCIRDRLRLARALVREPKLLVFDEATSALDPESEGVVQEAVDQLLSTRRCTMVVIAHRLSTVRRATKIAVVDGGRLVEEGTHDELLARPDSRYAAMLRMKDDDGGGASSGPIAPPSFEEPPPPSSSFIRSMAAYRLSGRARSSSCVPSCLLYTSPSPRDRTRSRMPSSA